VTCPDTAIVLTAGLGTRLRPLSSVRAKPAVPVAGEPIVRRILAWLAGCGVRDAVLNLHHAPQSIAVEVGDGSDLGVAVRYSWEQPILGSAGGPRRALPLLGRDTFLVVNGDTLTDVDLDRLAEAHADSGAAVTLALSPDRDSRRYGGVRLDANGTVVEFVRRGGHEPALHFVGVQIAHRSAFAHLPDGVPLESFTGVYPTLMANRPGSVRGFVSDAGFRDVGTLADYLTASLAVARREGLSAQPLGLRSTVHPSSRVVDSIVWNDVTVGPDCDLERCIVADGVVVPAGVSLRNAAIVVAGRDVAGPGERMLGNLLVAPIPPV
jgi:NDP-sugar pyrophosphorylase family protein